MRRKLITKMESGERYVQSSFCDCLLGLGEKLKHHRVEKKILRAFQHKPFYAVSPRADISSDPRFKEMRNGDESRNELKEIIQN